MVGLSRVQSVWLRVNLSVGQKKGKMAGEGLCQESLDAIIAQGPTHRPHFAPQQHSNCWPSVSFQAKEVSSAPRVT